MDPRKRPPDAVVAVAEPNDARRQAIAAMHDIPESRQFETWQDMLRSERYADAFIDATMDREHVASACRAMRLGYHMLLEKPMATSLPDQQEIGPVRQETGRIVSVCHSLRYHAVYERVYRLLHEGIIGEVPTRSHRRRAHPPSVRSWELAKRRAKSDQRTIDVWEFWAGNRHTHMDIPEEDGGYAGADERVMRNLLEALRSEDDSVVRTGTITFAAELARLKGRIVEIADLSAQLTPA